MEYEQFIGKITILLPIWLEKVQKTIPISSHNFKCGVKSKLVHYLKSAATLLGSNCLHEEKTTIRLRIKGLKYTDTDSTVIVPDHDGGRRK
jgi:hypothetical protein